MVELAGLEARRRKAKAMSFSSAAVKRRKAGAGKGKLLDSIHRLFDERASYSRVLHQLFTKMGELFKVIHGAPVGGSAAVTGDGVVEQHGKGVGRGGYGLPKGASGGDSRRK